MRIRTLLVFCLFATFLPGAQRWVEVAAATRYYVDAIGGDDLHDGHTRRQAWKAISKVNSASLGAGDSVFFKKGGEWREQLTMHNSGSAGNPIVFTAYGRGANPLINGSTVLTSGWVNNGEGVWKHAFAPSTPGSQDGGRLSNVFFDNVRGQEVGSVGEVRDAHKWYYDQTNSLYIYSTGDPATAFTGPGIEASDRYGIVPNGKSYLVIDGIDVTKANSGGIWASSYGDFLMIENLTSSFNGGQGIYSNAHNTSLIGCTMHDNGAGRHDHGVYFKGDSSLVEGCHAFRNGGAGITMVDCSGIIRYNTCDSNGLFANYRAPALDGFGVTMVPSPGQTIQCYYNILVDNFGHGVWISNGGSVYLYNNVIAGTKHYSDGTGLVATSSVGTVVVQNNIFYMQEAGCTDVYVVPSSANLVFDHNEYFGTRGTSISWMGAPFTAEHFSAFQAAKHQEVNGFVADPQFTDPLKHDFRPRASSPAKGAGKSVGLTVDHDRNPLPQGANVDIGAKVIR